MISGAGISVPSTFIVRLSGDALSIVFYLNPTTSWPSCASGGCCRPRRSEPLSRHAALRCSGSITSVRPRRLRSLKLRATSIAPVKRAYQPITQIIASAPAAGRSMTKNAKDTDAIPLSASQNSPEISLRGVAVYRRLSPPVLIDAMKLACEQSAAFHESLDPFAPARFPVSWAGEETSLTGLTRPAS
jgi:hypothetical protein